MGHLGRRESKQTSIADSFVVSTEGRARGLPGCLTPWTPGHGTAEPRAFFMLWTLPHVKLLEPSQPVPGGRGGLCSAASGWDLRTQSSFLLLPTWLTVTLVPSTRAVGDSQHPFLLDI